MKWVSGGVTFFGGEPYCIYEIDGLKFDSRDMSARFNAMAWLAMEKEDRRKVNRQFWELSKRKEVFGDQTAIYMGEWSDEELGYTKLRDTLAEKWEARYTGSLKIYMGMIFTAGFLKV
ncbi:MAG: hypothetical protein K6E98_05945 [Lachnospiraceae bacterium]|nr:hypothetical protein [Lachnospiraceae bacterium]